MDAIPAMTEQKRKIDMHVSIASKILSEIKKRKIDSLQDWQDEIMKNGVLATQSKADLFKYLQSSLNENDVFRLLILISHFC